MNLSKPERAFFTFILSLGLLGLVCCGVWFYFLLKQGMGLGWIIFDVTIILFSIWALVASIIPIIHKDDKRR